MGNFFSREVHQIQLSIAPDTAVLLKDTFRHEHHYEEPYRAGSYNTDRKVSTTQLHRPQHEHFYFETNMDIHAMFRRPSSNRASGRSAGRGQQGTDHEERGTAHTSHCCGHKRPEYCDVGASDDERELEQVMTEITEQWRTGRAVREASRVREVGERAIRRAIGTS